MTSAMLARATARSLFRLDEVRAVLFAAARTFGRRDLPTAELPAAAHEILVASLLFRRTEDRYLHLSLALRIALRRERERAELAAVVAARSDDFVGELLIEVGPAPARRLSLVGLDPLVSP